MPSFCVVSSCENKYSHTDNVSYHRFPQHMPNLLEKWIQFADRGSDWKPSQWSSICSRHFLPSDFRDSASRKRLRKDAVPSVTMELFSGNFLDFNNSYTEIKVSGTTHELSCRLCGLYCKTMAETFTKNFEIFRMIQKCFPASNIRNDDNLPKKLCPSCLQKLHSFSDFTDLVLRTQKEYEFKYSNKYIESYNQKIEKQFEIKQEPLISVKQEITENIQKPLESYLKTRSNDEEHFEQKSLVHKVPAINDFEKINNCDIIEVINLDSAYIDIADDDVGEEIKMHSENEIEYYILNNLLEEHNYTKISDIYAAKNYRNKQESSTNINSYPSIDCTKSNIVILNESILKPLVQNDLTCSICCQKFILKEDLESHQVSEHTKKKYDCLKCNLEFDTYPLFSNHRTKFHRFQKRKTLKKKLFLQCIICNKRFSSKFLLNVHRRNKNCKNKKCKINIKGNIVLKRSNENKLNLVSRRSALNIIKESTTQENPDPDNKLNCLICSRSYLRRSNLLKHEASHQPHDQWHFKCGICGYISKSIIDFKKHYQNECEKNSSNQSELIIYICLICGQEIYSLQRLKFHSATHSSKKSYTCQVCDKAFYGFNNLRQHTITHTTEKNYNCDLCEKSFKRKGGLTQHKKGFHMNIKPYECNVCARKYALKGDVQRCRHSLLKK